MTEELVVESSDHFGDSDQVLDPLHELVALELEVFIGLVTHLFLLLADAESLLHIQTVLFDDGQFLAHLEYFEFVEVDHLAHLLVAVLVVNLRH